MPEVTGSVELIEPKEKGGAKLTVRTDSGQTRTVHIPSNYEGDELAANDYGQFIYEEWKPDSWGSDRSAMKMVKSFKPMTKAVVNGASAISSTYRDTPSPSFSSSTPRSAPEITATEVLGQAKDIVVHLIDIGAIKEISDADSAWLALAEDGMTWHSQISKKPVDA